MTLADLITRHADQTALPGLVLKASSTVTEPMPGLALPMFVVVAQGAKHAVIGDRVLRYEAGEYLLVSAELPIVAHVSAAPYLVAGLTLRPTVIASLLLESGISHSSGGSGPGFAVGRATDELLDPFIRLLRLLDRPADLPVLAPATEREIVWRLLTGEHGAMVRQIGLADGRLAQIGRSIRWIREHYADLFRVEDAARVAGMSPTSFHRHFRAVTTMSPIQYQKQIRLQEARARLLAAPDDVAAVGFAVGYESASQFNREYRRLYGLPPGQDALRLALVPASARRDV